MIENVKSISLSPAKLFDLYLSGHGITSKWVADSLDVSLSLICSIRNNSCNLTEEMREKLNELLDTNY